MTPATKAAVASDLVMTAGGLAPRYAVVNTDISLAMSRLPVGDVIRIASSVRINRGWGSSEGTLHDAARPIRHCQQVAARAGAPAMTGPAADRWWNGLVLRHWLRQRRTGDRRRRRHRHGRRAAAARRRAPRRGSTTRLRHRRRDPGADGRDAHRDRMVVGRCACRGDRWRRSARSSRVDELVHAVTRARCPPPVRIARAARARRAGRGRRRRATGGRRPTARAGRSAAGDCKPDDTVVIVHTSGTTGRRNRSTSRSDRWPHGSTCTRR